MINKKVGESLMKLLNYSLDALENGKFDCNSHGFPDIIQIDLLVVYE